MPNVLALVNETFEKRSVLIGLSWGFMGDCKEVGMWPKELLTGSWIDCLDAIEKKIVSLRLILNNGPHGDKFREQLSNHEVRSKFHDIYRYAGKAVEDLKRQ